MLKLFKVAVALVIWLPMTLIAMVLAAGMVSGAVIKTVRDLLKQ
jgi:uncharacterized protein (DUF983 family)